MVQYHEIGRRIRQLRKAQSGKNGGMTQAELAQKVGISTSFMGHIERGTRIPSLETLVGLAEALRVSLDVLVTGMDMGQGGSANTTVKMRMLNDIMRILDAYAEEWLGEG